MTLDEYSIKEIEIRGATLKASAIIEMAIMTTIYQSSAEIYKKENKRFLNLEKLTFGKKIFRLKEVITKFHPDLLSEYEIVMKKLLHFGDFRNKIAHFTINWIDQHRFDIWVNTQTEKGFHYFKPEEISVKESFSSIHNGMIVLPDLERIQNKISERLAVSCPEIYLLLNPK